MPNEHVSNIRLHTNGKGFWSEKAKEVMLMGLAVPYVNEERDYGELRVYFDTKSWNTDEDGLIYTDKQFQEELIKMLIELGFSARNNVYYSEQGMQGDDFVSFDCADSFITDWLAKFGERDTFIEGSD